MPAAFRAVSTCRAPLLARHLEEQERQLDVLARRQHRDEVVDLEDVADVAHPPASRARRRTGRRGPPPATTTRPLVGVSMPAMRLSSVVLPEPDGPMRLRNSPSATVEGDAVQRPDLDRALLVDLRQVLRLRRCSTRVIPSAAPRLEVRSRLSRRSRRVSRLEPGRASTTTRSPPLGLSSRRRDRPRAPRGRPACAV